MIERMREGCREGWRDDYAENVRGLAYEKEGDSVGEQRAREREEMGI